MCGFTAGIIAAMFHSAGWDLDWDTSDIRDLEQTLKASGNGERDRMSAEEARREHSDSLADRTVAGVPGVRSGHDDDDDDNAAGADAAAADDDAAAAGADAAAGATSVSTVGEEPLDLPADNPRRGYR